MGKEFKIVEGSIANVQRIVMALLNDGWNLHGFTIYMGGRIGNFSQCLTKNVLNSDLSDIDVNAVHDNSANNQAIARQPAQSNNTPSQSRDITSDVVTAGIVHTSMGGFSD